MSMPDIESGGERINPALREALELLDYEIETRLEEIAERVHLPREQVLALSVLFFATQLEMRDSGKMVVVCARPATAYEDPLQALFAEAPTQQYQEIYDQVLAPQE
ncbi:hypothetical protein [Nocardia sp. NPDC050710]|uniref:hypothetical protein n=1 Tax=Nocardia sp. NPDC050710 TaxID=3157220 RepID=UPI0033C89D23